MHVRRKLVRFLGGFSRPRILLPHSDWSSFRFCGCIGLALSTLLAMGLVMWQGLSSWVMAGVTVASVLVFFGLAMAAKIVTGEESLTYYHHQVAVIIVTILLLWLLHQPILPHLGVTILGVGLFLACGRVGCLMVGCCHGRPHRWGVCYREEHAAPASCRNSAGYRIFQFTPDLPAHEQGDECATR